MVTYVTPKAIYKSDVIREALRKWDEGVARLHISDLASLLPQVGEGHFSETLKSPAFPLADSFSRRHPPSVNPGKRIISQPPLPNAQVVRMLVEERYR